MTWTPSRELEDQALREINRLRDEMRRAQETERKRLANQHSAGGTLRSGQFLWDVGQDIEKRLMAFASGLVDTSVDLARLGGAPSHDDLAAWVNQLFETHFVTEATRFANSLVDMLKQFNINIPGQHAWDQMNDMIMRARQDRDITLGRLKLQTPDRQESLRPESLNQLPTRDVLNRDLDAMLATGVVCSVLFMDLDGFKQVNDTKGHTEGDRCLETVAAVLQSALRSKGSVYRYGGDEFVALLPNFDATEATATGERIREAIVTANPGGELRVSASVGVASSQHPGFGNTPALLNAADQAMYLSKHSGGNRVTRSSIDSRVEPDESPRGASPERIQLLVELTEFAVHRLLNDPQKDFAHNLSTRVDAWEAQVLSALTESDASEVDKSWFRVLSTYQPAGLDGATPEHVKIRNELAEKIERVREITRRLEERLRTRRR